MAQMPTRPAYLGNDPAYGPQYRQQGGIGDALANSIYLLAQMFAPKSLTQRDAKIEQATDAASTNPQTTDLGNQF